MFTKKIKHQIPHKTEIGFLHEVQRNYQLLQEMSSSKFPIADLRPKLYFDKSDEKVINELKVKSPYIVMAPSSVWYTKQWHKSKWKELISIIDKKFNIYLIGAPSDESYIKELMISDNVHNLCGKLSLRQSALFMKDATRVFVNDSAPLHLASSVNAKTTAIFCSTIPEFGYGPLADNHKVIQLEPRLKCMPCGLHGKKECPLEHFDCSQKIDINSVLSTI